MNKDLCFEKILNNKKRFLELLLLADEEEKMIDRYLERGDMYICRKADGRGGDNGASNAETEGFSSGEQAFYKSKGKEGSVLQNDALSVCVVTDEGEGVIEIKNLAVRPEYQGLGIGRKMIEFISGKYPEAKLLQVGTGESLATLPFYEKCGFHYSHRIKDFFTDNYPEPIYDGGVLLKDMVYLKKSIRRREELKNVSN